MCETWSNKYINTIQKRSKYFTLLQKMCCRYWVEIILKFVATMLLQNQNDLILLQCWSNNNLFEATWDHLRFFLALSTQPITLQAPEKSCKWLNCQNVLLWFTFVLIGCVQQLPGKDILVHNQRQKHYKTRVIYVLQNDTYLQMETPFT